MAAERSPTTIQTESHTYIEIEIHATLFLLLNADGMDRGRESNDDVQQHGGHTYATLVDSVHI